MILEEVPTDFIDEYKIIHFIGYGSQAKYTHQYPE